MRKITEQEFLQDMERKGFIVPEMRDRVRAAPCNCFSCEAGFTPGWVLERVKK